MTLFQLLQCAKSDLGLLEPIGDALIEKADIAYALNTHEGIVLSLWFYIATNPEWEPLPVDRDAVQASLRTVGEDELADRLPEALFSPDFKIANQVLKACARYVRGHAPNFDLGGDLRMRGADEDHPLPLERMAAIFRHTPSPAPWDATGDKTWA